MISDQQTDRQTDRQTDIVNYRVACTRLKREKKEKKILITELDYLFFKDVFLIIVHFFKFVCISSLSISFLLSCIFGFGFCRKKRLNLDCCGNIKDFEEKKMMFEASCIVDFLCECYMIERKRANYVLGLIKEYKRIQRNDR